MNGLATHSRAQSSNGYANGARAHAHAHANGHGLANGGQAGGGQDWRQVTAVDAVREKKRKGRESGYDEDEVYDAAEAAPRAPAKRQKGATASGPPYDDHPLPALPALPPNGLPPADLPPTHAPPPAPAPAPPKKAAARRKPAKQAAAATAPVPTAPLAATLPPPAAVPERAVAVDKVAVEVAPVAGEVLPEVEDQDLYCFCQTPSYGEMIGCDRDECERQWVSLHGSDRSAWWRCADSDFCVQFHLPCVGLKAIPKGQWYCDDCVAIVSDTDSCGCSSLTSADQPPTPSRSATGQPTKRAQSGGSHTARSVHLRRISLRSACCLSYACSRRRSTHLSA